MKQGSQWPGEGWGERKRRPLRGNHADLFQKGLGVFIGGSEREKVAFERGDASSVSDRCDS